MTFDWNNYVILADELRTMNCKGGAEARLRSAVSRAYYGVFHQVRAALDKEGTALRSGADLHQEVVRLLRTSGDRNRLRLGINLGRLRQYRNAADYDDAIDNVAQTEALASRLASSIQQQVATGFKNSR